MLGNVDKRFLKAKKPMVIERQFIRLDYDINLVTVDNSKGKVKLEIYNKWQHTTSVSFSILSSDWVPHKAETGENQLQLIMLVTPYGDTDPYKVELYNGPIRLEELSSFARSIAKLLRDISIQGSPSDPVVEINLNNFNIKLNNKLVEDEELC